MPAARQPQHLSQALSELIALRGLARVRGDAQLDEVWREVAGSDIARQTKVLGISRGILQIGVSNSPLLSELALFHKFSLLKVLQEQHAGLNIHDIKFRRKTFSEKRSKK